MFNSFPWYSEGLFHYVCLKGTLRAVKERGISCTKTDKYSLLCECWASDIELSEHLSNNSQLRQQSRRSNETHLGLAKLWGKSRRPRNRHGFANSEYKNSTSIYLSRTAYLISFNYWWGIQQCISNKRRDMVLTETPLQLVSNHFCGGNCPVLGLYLSMSLAPRLRDEYSCTSSPFWGIMSCSTLKLTFCQREDVVVICNITCIGRL